MSEDQAPMVNGHRTGEEVLPFEEDDYGGVIVEMKTPMDPKCFIATLRYSFTQWRLQEKHGTLRGSGVWKIPTGVVDEGEEIFTAAIREVNEETGIDTEFLEILAFCQYHESFFAKSDLFFICLLRPTSFDIQKQDLEIEAAQWMRFEDSASQPITHENELFKEIHRIFSMKMEKSYTGFSKKPITLFFDDKLGYLYWNKQEMINHIS